MSSTLWLHFRGLLCAKIRLIHPVTFQILKIFRGLRTSFAGPHPYLGLRPCASGASRRPSKRQLVPILPTLRNDHCCRCGKHPFYRNWSGREGDVLGNKPITRISAEIFGRLSAGKIRRIFIYRRQLRVCSGIDDCQTGVVKPWHTYCQHQRLTVRRSSAEKTFCSDVFRICRYLKTVGHSQCGRIQWTPFSSWNQMKPTSLAGYFSATALSGWVLHGGLLQLVFLSLQTLQTKIAVNLRAELWVCSWSSWLSTTAVMRVLVCAAVWAVDVLFEY